MKLEDVQNKKSKHTKSVSARVSEEDYRFIKQNKINISFLIRKGIEEVKGDMK